MEEASLEVQKDGFIDPTDFDGCTVIFSTCDYWRGASEVQWLKCQSGIKEIQVQIPHFGLVILSQFTSQGYFKDKVEVRRTVSSFEDL